MKRSAIHTALTTLLVTTGCAGAPQYAPPTDEEAKAAVIRSIRADLIDKPMVIRVAPPADIGPGDTPGSAMRKVGGVLADASEMADRDGAQARIASLASMRVSDCQWSVMRGNLVRAYGGDRVDQVGRGYWCNYEQRHDTKTRGLVRATGKGYFFQRDGKYDFASIEQDSFEKVPDGE